MCIVCCSGSFATASCCKCHYRVDCDAIRQDIMKQVLYHYSRSYTQTLRIDLISGSECLSYLIRMSEIL